MDKSNFKIYTKTGDKGTTSLYDGTRVDKDNIRVEAYGTLDELGAWLGLGSNHVDPDTLEDIRHIQNKLFVVNHQLATKDKSKIKYRISQADIKHLEDLVDKYMDKAGDFEGFILNGSSEPAAIFHLARTVCRRAERRIVSLASIEEMEEELIQYVNRLADTLYAIAKSLEEEIVDVNWDE